MTWIGVIFSIAAPCTVVLTLPERFVLDLRRALQPFMQGSGTVSLKQAQRIAGRIARVAHVIPAATPYAASFWAALSEARKADGLSRREAPPGKGAARIFSQAAAWIYALLLPGGPREGLVPLERRVSAAPAAGMADGAGSQATVVFDASVWGGGAILLLPGSDTVAEYLCFDWPEELCRLFQVSTGLAKHQAFWEMLTLYVSLLTWAADFRECGLRCLGDASGALACIRSLKGAGILNHIAREISWRRVRYGWKYGLGHVPGSRNRIADALSRQSSPTPSTFPAECVAALRRPEPEWSEIWDALVTRAPP